LGDAKDDKKQDSRAKPHSSGFNGRGSGRAIGKENGTGGTAVLNFFTIVYTFIFTVSLSQ
jgi:hypothetical protein